MVLVLPGDDILLEVMDPLSSVVVGGSASTVGANESSSTPCSVSWTSHSAEVGLRLGVVSPNHVFELSNRQVSTWVSLPWG